MEEFELELFADYHQFYLQDDEAGKGDLGDAWSEEATERLLAVSSYAIGIGTVRNMDVQVFVKICEKEPSINIKNWDHVVISSIECETGKLVVAGCSDYFPDAQRIELSPGHYQVLACYKGLETISEDGLDGDDQYYLFIYPGHAQDVKVIKSRSKG
ncbi:Uncharacterised protein [BD1-7 clade bacterium]|nr:Uncharacterised protein [BD1-7 clade bacterium]